jgi:NAD(P)-dependent dehydrogenase (short-subunit alcohol dehydrogenase family)
VTDHDPNFPAAGARFSHRVGLRPMTLSDHTEVVSVDPPWRIELKAKARPLGTADIEIELRERAGGTEVTLTETPGDRLSALVATNPVADTALRLRNAEALSRLKRAVEGRPEPAPRRRRDPEGQRILITGGSSGIGLAVAELLAAEGARLVLLARDEGGLATAKKRVLAVGGEVHTVRADVRDREAVGAAIDQAVTLLGGLDVLITGAAGAAFGPFVETDPEDFEATVETVLIGSANSIRAALPHLEASTGAVISIGSTAAHLPLPGLSAYSAAKHGLVGLLDSLRIELREAGAATTISLVNPGPVDTPLWNHLQSQTGLLPPVPPDRYSAQSIAAAVVSVFRRPREETTVGGSAYLQVCLFAVLRGPTSKAMTVLGRLAQSAEDEVSTGGALHEGGGTGSVEGGYGGRGSLAVRGIGAIDAVARRLGR